MIISDLSYLETVSETSVGGGDAQVSSYQLTYTNGEVTETTSGSPVLKEVLPDGSTRYFSTLGNSLVSITLSSGIMQLLQ